MRADAVSVANAQPLNGLSWIQSRRLSRLVAKGVIRETTPGSYYLSAPDYATHQVARRHRIAVAMVIVLAFAALTIYFSAR